MAHDIMEEMRTSAGSETAEIGQIGYAKGAGIKPIKLIKINLTSNFNFASSPQPGTLWIHRWKKLMKHHTKEIHYAHLISGLQLVPLHEQKRALATKVQNSNPGKNSDLLSSAESCASLAPPALCTRASISVDTNLWLAYRTIGVDLATWQTSLSRRCCAAFAPAFRKVQCFCFAVSQSALQTSATAPRSTSSNCAARQMRGSFASSASSLPVSLK